jgi:hypothetical protein
MSDLLGLAGIAPSPLPGDPAAVAEDAAMYARTADAIEDAIARIGRLATNDFRSLAVSALHGEQGDIVEDITRAYARYRNAGDALTGYAALMQDAHDQADAAIRAWHSANDALQQVGPALADATQRAQSPGPDQPFALTDLARLSNDQSMLTGLRQAALQQWAQASEAQTRAAHQAAIHINAGNKANDLNDDLWDSIGDIVDVLNVVNAFVRAVLKIVSLIMTILAIVFAIAAIFFQPFAAVAAALFGYAQLINLAIALLALLQFLMDGFHLMDLVVVGIAVVAAFGGAVVGKVLGAATNAAVSGALSGFGEVASKAAATAATQAVTTAVKEVTDAAVHEILDLGSDDAQALFDDLNPVASGFLDTAFSDQVGAATGMGEKIGGWVGADLAEGVAATGLPAAASAGISAAGHVLAPVYDGVASTAAKIDEGLRSAQHSVQQTAGGVVSDVTGGLAGVTDQGNRIGADLSSVLGQPGVGDAVGDFAKGLGEKALGDLPGGDVLSGVWGSRIGDLAGSMQSAAQHGGVPTTAAGR